MEVAMIIVKNINMDFRLSSNRTLSLKDYFIRSVKGKMEIKTFKALDNVSFQVYPGEIMGIIGANGAGKSTLLKIISGVLKPTSGRLRVNGSVVPMLELGSGFDYELTARENIYLNGALLGYDKKYISRNVMNIAKYAGVEEFLDERLTKFSSGMVARLAFSIASAREQPEILILDEILSVGDIFFKKKSEERMVEMMKSGATVLLVSHSLDVIRKNCTRVLWLEKGRIKMLGDPREVCDTYQKSGSCS